MEFLIIYIKKNLRAALQNQLGKYFLERLKFAVISLKENKLISDNDNINNVVNKKIFTFNTLNIVWPQIKDVINIKRDNDGITTISIYDFLLKENSLDC